MSRYIYMITASWCPPCRTAERVIVPAVLQACPGQMTVIDIIKNPSGLCREYDVTKTPTFLLMEDGVLAEKHVGIFPRADTLIRWLKEGGALF